VSRTIGIFVRARRRALGVAALSACLLVQAGAASATEAVQAAWPQVERVVAFADVHGAYTELTALLRSAGVVDDGLHWSAGRSHVVSLGDLLDRGADSRKVMDLLMRLQAEASAAGGRLHVVLGNHEAMNLLGDLRDVVPGEFAAYAADEPQGVRESLRADWISRHGPDHGAAFDQRFPPGFFGHRAALAPGGRYGRWLLAQPVAIVIDETLFMHGGPSRLLAGKSLQEINLRYRTAIADYLGSLAQLEAAGLVRPEDEFAQRAALAQQRLAALPAADNAARMALAEAVQKFVAADANPWIERDGPNWYRGAALCNECSEADVLDPVLGALGVKRLVIGHTVARNAHVASRFDGRVIKLDAGMNRAVYRGNAAALVIERGAHGVLYSSEPTPPAAIPEEPLYVAYQALEDTRVAGVLAAGTVTMVGPRAPGTVDVMVEHEGRKVPAVFVTDTREAVRREIAAYRVDRMLDLGIVPATVEREVQGQRGYVQARPSRWVTQAEVRTKGLRGGGWCAYEPQFELVYSFDALTGNEGRTEDRLLFDAAEWLVLATGHDRAFGSGTSFPRYLESRTANPGAELRRRLARLDDASLAVALADLLTARERRALLARRDALLAAKPEAGQERPPSQKR
jgi:hypothetical protein